MHNHLSLNDLDIFPVMGEKINSLNSVKLDFSAQNESLSSIDLSNTELFNEYVFQQIGSKTYGYGGYLENRVIYIRSEHFQKGDSRCMHLGLDVWTEAFYPIYSPLDATVHSFQDNNNYGDYGPTIILEHEIKGQKIYTLYGHLSIKSLEGITPGVHIPKGQKFCELGPYPENGDWPPHLHFQVMNTMEGRSGDFPGVCSPNELLHYQEICLDPHPFFI